MRVVRAIHERHPFSVHAAVMPPHQISHCIYDRALCVSPNCICVSMLCVLSLGTWYRTNNIVYMRTYDMERWRTCLHSTVLEFVVVAQQLPQQQRQQRNQHRQQHMSFNHTEKEREKAVSSSHFSQTSHGNHWNRPFHTHSFRVRSLRNTKKETSSDSNVTNDIITFADACAQNRYMPSGACGVVCACVLTH